MSKSHKLFFGMFGIGALLTIAAGLWAYFTIGGARHVLIVHFDAFNGIDFLGTRRDVLGIALSAAVMNAVNFLLGNAFYSRERFVAWMIAAVNLLVSICVLAVIGIIIVNN